MLILQVNASSNYINTHCTQHLMVCVCEAVLPDIWWQTRGSPCWHGSRESLFQTSFSPSLSQWEQASWNTQKHTRKSTLRLLMLMQVPVWWSGLPVHFPRTSSIISAITLGLF